MRTIGIDLSARGEHKAVIADEAGRYVSAVFRFETTPASLQRLLDMAQENNRSTAKVTQSYFRKSQGEEPASVVRAAAVDVELVWWNGCGI